MSIPLCPCFAMAFLTVVSCQIPHAGWDRRVYTCSMRYPAFLMICLAAISSAQNVSQVTTAPLSHEQAAVYRAALSGFEEGSRYDVIDLTGLLRPDEGDYAGCMKGFPASTSSQTLHRLSQKFATTTHVHLISPEMAAEHPFPNGMTGSGVRSMTAPPPPPPKHLEPMRSRVVLSEIIFDSRHRRAALNISVSGPGMGHSETHVYQITDGKWIPIADCGSGIS